MVAKIAQRHNYYNKKLLHFGAGYGIIRHLTQGGMAMRGWAIGICAVSLLLALCACQGAKRPGLPVTESTEVSSHTTEQLPMEDVLYYQNPVMSAKTADAWRGYGFGDPFVMRHNGTYYLYVSTKDGEVGVQCWTSQDLVNWPYEGIRATH